MKNKVTTMKARLQKCAMGAAITVLAVFYGSAPASAGVLSQTVSFSSQNQSMWGTGSALQYQKNIFIGTTWNKSATFGPGFIGGTTQIINPAWVACLELCNLPHYLTVNTKSGLQVAASTTGKVGFQLGLNFNSGSVDALPNYTTNVDVPTSVSAGQLVSLNTGSSLASGSLNSTFPTASATLSAVLDVSASVAATGCLTGSCASASFSTGNLGGTQQLIAVNPNGNGGIQYFGGSGPLYDALQAALTAGSVTLPTGFPATLDIPGSGTGSLGSITAYLPDPNASGGVNASHTELTATGSSPALSASLDVGNVISEAFTGTTGLFDGSAPHMPSGFSLNYNLLNVQMGPQINLQQTFDLTPTLYANLQFSQPVNVTGHGLVSSLDGVDWNNLPSMIFGSGVTTITPTFYLGTSANGTFMKNAATLLDELKLALLGNISVDLLNGTFDTPFGNISFGLPQLLNQSISLFTTPPIYSNTFAMAGFSPAVGQSFSIDTGSSSGAVPEPGTLVLAGEALLVLGLMQWLADRRRREGRNL